MATLEKLRRKKVTSIAPGTSKTTKTAGNKGSTSVQSSVISVKEAVSSDQHDTIENADNRSLAGASTPAAVPQTSESPAPAASPPVTQQVPERPVSARSHLSNKSQLNIPAAPGSMVSLKSREAWTENGDQSNVGSGASDKLGPAEMNESHAYVPYVQARQCIMRITDDMKAMKQNHIRIVHDIEDNFRSIEDETQAQFNLFVLNLRDQYAIKVKTFRQVIEVHRLELQQKEQYWDEALMSMSSRNKNLLQDKKVLLIQNKVEFERLEKEKNETISKLTAKMDENSAAFAAAKIEIQTSYEDKIKALTEEQKIIEDSLESEKKEKMRLEEEIEELRRRPPPQVVAAQVETQESRATPAVLVAGLSTDDADHLETERRQLAAEREAMAADRKRAEEDREQFTEQRRRFQEDQVVLQGDLNTAVKEKEVWRVKYESLKDQLGELADIKAKYDILNAQLAAVSAVAVGAVAADKAKADDEISKATSDHEFMMETKVQMDRDIEKWEADFKEREKRDPLPSDRPDSIDELYVSRAEAETMVSSLETKISTLETLKSGELPAAPTVAAAAAIDVREPEVKTVEVKVPDPEVVASLQAAQDEVEKLKSSLAAAQEESLLLKGTVGDLESKLAKAKAGSNKDLENRVKTLQKEKKALEKKLANAKSKQDASAETEQLKRLLEITVREVRNVNEQAEVAARLVSERLQSVKGSKDEVNSQNEEKKREYQEWLNEWTKKHGSEPNTEEREGDAHGSEVYAAAEEAASVAEDRDLAEQALVMISTGTVPAAIAPAPQLSVQAAVAVSGGVSTDSTELQEEIDELKDQVEELQGLNEELKSDKEELQQRVSELEDQLSAGVGLGAVSALDSSSDDLQELSKQITQLQQQVDEGDARLAQEVAAHAMTRDELEAIQAQLEALRSEAEQARVTATANLEATTGKLNVEITNLKKKLETSEKRIEELDKARLANLPVDTQKEIKDLKAKLASSEKEKDAKLSLIAGLEADLKQQKAQMSSIEATNSSQKAASAGAEQKLKQLKAQKDKEIKELTAKFEKKEKDRIAQEEKKVDALNKKIQKLEAAGAAGVGAAAGKGKDKGGADKATMEKVREAQRELREAQNKIKQLENELKSAQKSSGGSNIEAERDRKKQEKVLKELEKKLDQMSKKNEKNEQNLKKREEELEATTKDLSARDKEVVTLKAELQALGVAAAEGLETAAKAKELEGEVKRLTAENKELTDNYNSERVLRKKYYNMVEDMKGKIRVYCRVRPMSRSELDRGCNQICKSPDEYTINVDSSRGVKEFQFDSIFMPEHSQEKVFEDTNNLIQSAVDGYNVCIFAYGQTGSGKTYTVIGASDGSSPGIAPRAFDRIYELADELKAKFTFKVSVYMLELYNDKLLDLFAKGGGSEDKMDIKKDKKGMVVVQGAEVKNAKNSKELWTLFEEGSKTRHVASTKMNSESSRSHLVVGIVIESTNKVSGQVTKGKLSLVDLAGSERAAKTGATAEQLKEAMSINKSLSALGDVISALSSEQSFIPYRNNKLTMLMQDSLGGNAKTLMFVNVSPADYNADETVTSLTYAARVKLITNDASKNADNKEINRLKGIIAKLKKGESLDEEDGGEEEA